MRIGELAEKSGVSVRSLRYYEEQSLLHSSRSESGQRLYLAAAVGRVILIQRLYAAGLSSRTFARAAALPGNAGGALHPAAAGPTDPGA